MTIDQIRTKVREITNTTTADYSDASLVRDLNAATVKINTFIKTKRGPLEFDDPNSTGYTWESLTLDGSSDTYDVQTDEHSDDIYTVHKVVISGVDVPRLIFTEGNQAGVLNATDTANVPDGFYDLGKAIRFTQIPNAGTATIYYDRAHHFIETGDTSLELGLPQPYHMWACYETSLPYLVDKRAANLGEVVQFIEREKMSLEEFEMERRGDESVHLTVETFSGI